MEDTISTLVPILTLVVGLSGGWIIGRLKPGPFAFGPGNHLIRVGPTAKDVGTAMRKVHMAGWKARGQKKTLEIRFKAIDFPPDANHEPPFKGGINNQDQVFRCGPGEVCKSGDVNPNLNPPADGFYYKYWQTLIDQNGNQDTEDAGIIIER